MAIIVKNSIFLSLYPYVYTYPLAISPQNVSITRHGKHGNNLMRSCCPCVSDGNIGVRRSNDVYSHDPRLSSLYGYEDGTTLAHRRFGYQVITRASKQADNGNEKFGKVEDYTQEEQRWIREEQRWVREEQRWVREEARWNAERESLLHQVSDLTLKIQDLELELKSRRNRVGSMDTVPEMLNKISSLLQVLNSYTGRISSSNSMTPIQNQISEYGLEDTGSETEVSETIAPPAPDLTPPPTPISNPESKDKADHEQKQKQKQQRSLCSSLRMGSEGEEVQSLQEALLSLGFYSGEEDMEFSSFSDGTQRAVKTWQASIGVPEDGVMTSELLETLYGTQKVDKFGSSVNGDQNTTLKKQDETNGAAFMAREDEKTVIKKGLTDVEVSQHRVYLLGENRWEEPSRLTKQNGKKVNGDTTRASATKCLACRGEGRLLCMECDGSGEPNLEPQFMEWVEEGSKCPYCDGLGYTVCDLCQGNATA